MKTSEREPQRRKGPRNKGNEISRRRLLELALYSAAALVGVKLGIDKKPASSNLTSTPVVDSISVNTRPAIVAPASLESFPFADRDALEVCKDIGLEAGMFFKFPEEKTPIWNKFDAFLDDVLYPVYPPSVMQWKGLITDLSKEFDLPPNIVATLMAIESCGYRDAGSDAGAIGLFQAMDDKFALEIQVLRDRYGNIIDSDDEIQRKLRIKREPYRNGRAGLNYLKNSCIPAAVNDDRNKSLKPNGLLLWARTIISYNGGAGKAAVPFGELYPESQFYGDFFTRFAITMQVAKGLKKKNFSDKEVIKKLVSPELDARSYALNQFKERKQATMGKMSYESYNEAVTELSFATPGINRATGQMSELGRQINKDYLFYLNNPFHELPMSVGLRSWIDLGGLWLFNLGSNKDINHNKDNWVK